MLDGFATASAWAAGIITVGAVLVTVLMNTPRPKSPAATADSGTKWDAAPEAEGAVQVHA